MSLRKSPERTPAFHAAHRRNAQKCTGPKTPKGKARSSLNALMHGRFAEMKRCSRKTNNLSQRRQAGQNK
jgi:hypothetical protein